MTSALESWQLLLGFCIFIYFILIFNFKFEEIADKIYERSKKESDEAYELKRRKSAKK